jgi:tetratricopeptide (TPR) repeat protein
VLFVTGEPGIGKTALVDTFLTRAALEDEILVARGQCQELYGKGEAYMPVLEALERLCREPAGRRLVPLLSRHAPTWLVQMPSLLEVAEHQALACRAAGTTPARMLREIGVALEELTSEIPLVLVLEDLHWSDGSTVDLVSALARRRDPARLLLIGTCRREAMKAEGNPLRAVFQELQIHRQCVELPLPGLKPSSIGEYLNAKLPGGEKTDNLVELFYRLSGGNPLFLETMVDDLVDRGFLVEEEDRWVLTRRTEEVGVADSLQQMIQEKIEALSEEEQQLLEVGSVAGMEFSAVLAAAAMGHEVTVVEERYERLVRRGQFLRSSGLEEWPDGTLAGRYSFLHTLHRSVIYRRLTAARRVRLHRRIGEALKRGYEDRVEEVTAELAMHFERGRSYRQAVRHHVLAAQKALRRSAHREAIAYLSRGLDLLKLLPDDAECRRQELALYSAFGLALVATRGFGAEEVGQFFAWADELGRQLRERSGQLASRWGLAFFHLMRADFGAAQEIAEQCLGEGRQRQDPALCTLGHCLIGMTRFHRGEPPAALAHLESGVSLSGPPRAAVELGTEPQVFALSHLGLVLWLLGYPEQALERCGEAVAMARRIEDPQSLACARNCRGMVYQLCGEAGAARREAEAVLKISSEQGFPLWSACGSMLRGWSLSDSEPEEAIRSLCQALEMWETTRSISWRCGYLGVLAAARGKAGRIDEALATVAEALDAAGRHGERWNEADLLRLRGELQLLDPARAPAEAEESFRRAIEVARRQSAKSWELRAVVSLGRVLRQQGREREAEALLVEVYGRFTEGFERPDLRQAREMLDDIAAAA